MSTDFTKRFKIWRLTFAVSLPGWMKSAVWLFHPIRTYRELLATREAERQAQRQHELEKKWEKLFCDAFSQKKPEFEFDPKGSGRVLGLKETLAESKIPSVGVWGGGMDQGAVDRALRGTGVKVNFDVADEETVERRQATVEKIREEIWEEERATRTKRKRDMC